MPEKKRDGHKKNDVHGNSLEDVPVNPFAAPQKRDVASNNN